MGERKLDLPRLYRPAHEDWMAGEAEIRSLSVRVGLSAWLTLRRFQRRGKPSALGEPFSTRDRRSPPRSSSGPVRNVVTSAMSTRMAKMGGGSTPRSYPMFSRSEERRVGK